MLLDKAFEQKIVRQRTDIHLSPDCIVTDTHKKKRMNDKPRKRQDSKQSRTTVTADFLAQKNNGQGGSAVRHSNPTFTKKRTQC